jgi:hypothetical protein
MSGYYPSNPLIAQSDRTVLLEVNNPEYEEARDALARFAELEKSPEHIHTYRITPLSLWNAAAAGLEAERIVGDLERFGKYELPGNVRADIVEAVARYGRVKLIQDGQHLLLVSDDRPLLVEIERHKQIAACLIGRHVSGGLLVDPAKRGHIKQSLLQFGYPAEDLAGYVSGAPLDISLRTTTQEGRSFTLRDYQQAAVEVFYVGGSSRGGSGVIVLPRSPADRSRAPGLPGGTRVEPGPWPGAREHPALVGALRQRAAVRRAESDRIERGRADGGGAGRGAGHATARGTRDLSASAGYRAGGRRNGDRQAGAAGLCAQGRTR